MIEAMGRSCGFLIGVAIGALLAPGPASAGMVAGAFAMWLYACRMLTK